MAPRRGLCALRLDLLLHSWLLANVHPIFSPRALYPGVAIFAIAAVSIAAQESPRSAARELLRKLAKSDDPTTLDLRQRGEAAARRSDTLQREGDRPHADMAGEIALEWAQAATALERAKTTEDRADDLERRLTETETKLARARALLEQANARKGRAEARLKQAELDRPGNAATATPPPAPEKP